MNIFYIEKEKLLSAFFEISLRKMQHQVFTIDSIDCYYMIQDLCPDLVLVACTFEHESILNLVEKIRSNEKTQSIKVIGVGFEDELSGIRNVCDSLLVKPIKVENLEKKLLSFLSQVK